MATSVRATHTRLLPAIARELIEVTLLLLGVVVIAAPLLLTVVLGIASLERQAISGIGRGFEG